MDDRSKLLRLKVIPIMVFLMKVQGSPLDKFWIATPNSGSTNTDATSNLTDYTINLAQYGLDMINRSSVIFEVKCCGDAFVTLIDSYDAPSPIVYDIGLGTHGNAVVNVMIGGPGPGNDLFVSSVNILDCNEYRKFWVTWEDNGNIHLGKGLELYKEEILLWTPGTVWNIKFMGIGIRTGWGSTGTWIIHNKANHGGKFCGKSGVIADMNVLGYTTHRSLLRCTFACYQNSKCLAVNYRKDTKECRLLVGDQLIKTSVNEKWHFMAKCLQGMGGCVGCIS